MPISNIPHRVQTERRASSTTAIIRGGFILIVLTLTVFAVVQILTT